jgi:hypothetical protein
MDYSNLVKNGQLDLNEYNRIIGYAKAMAVLKAYGALRDNLQSTSSYWIAMGHIDQYQSKIKELCT